MRVRCRRGAGARHAVCIVASDLAVLFGALRQQTVGIQPGQRLQLAVQGVPQLFHETPPGVCVCKVRLGDFLLEEDFNKSSRIFESAVASWLSGKDDEEKKAFIDALFDMLEESGIEKTEDLWSDKMRLKPVFRILRSMTREERDSFFSFFTALLRETGIAVQKNLFADEEMSEGR